MTTEDIANADGANTATTATTAAPETEKVETKATAGEEQAAATTEDGNQPDAANDPAKEAEAASEAAKALQKRKQTMQERLNEVTHARRDAERRAERAERELAQLRGRMKAPVADQYEDPAKLTADQVNHTLDQREAQRLEDEHKNAKSDAQVARALAWAERVEAFKESASDFEKVAFSAQIGEDTSLMVADMEDGPAVAYHLGKNPAEARRIDKLSNREKAFELGRIAERLTTKPLPRITAAPNPVSAVSGRLSGSNPDPSKMSQAEFEKWWGSKK